MTNNLPDIQIISKAIASATAFAIWSYPGEQKVQSTFCNADKLIKTYSTKNLDKHKGFVFAPFQVCKHLPIYILPFSESLEPIDFDATVASKKFVAERDVYSSNLEVSRKEHLSQVKEFATVFETTEIKKAVLSRNKWIPDYNIKQMPALFEKLVKTYPNAFVYQVFIPGSGYWVGATPELLLSSNNGSATTVSLAGTQPYTKSNEIVWNRKEKVEQELVTEHIRSVLTDFDITDIKETGPETAKAGDLAHIKTQLDFNKEKIKNKLGSFIEKLHPTPAVCGLPVKDSLELILETEGYDRAYYTGYLGTFNPEEKTALYVNLRCLQAFDNGVVLYAGGGITPESDPEKEWEETRLKIQTLEKILNTL